MRTLVNYVSPAALVLALGAMASASPIVWTISNGSVQGGGMAGLSGMVTLNLQNATATAWDVSAGSRSFDTANSNLALSSNLQTLTFANLSTGNLALNLASPLTAAGGTVGFTGTLKLQTGGHLAVSGNLSSGEAPLTTPEPATWALLATGLLGFAGVRHRLFA
ncbi:MAG: PEP-CTERM sorting domain-containing protein [Terriglobales bacterium]